MMLRVVRRGNKLLTRHTLRTLSASIQEDELSIKVLKGLDYRIYETSPENHVAMATVVDSLFQNPIMKDSNKSELGGEKVLTSLFPTDEHESSVHLMSFEGNQESHIHRGARVLTIIAPEEWKLTAGGIVDPQIVRSDTEITAVKLVFPANSLTALRFPANFVHSFEGKNLAAISVHYTDAREAKEITGDEASSFSLTDKDLMVKLTMTMKNVHIAEELDARHAKDRIAQKTEA
eukprot:m.90918 g.90918  ORF g.90918 m.90918 type:complete len:234 (-) comp13281_c0_seq2:3405-4106(-)